MASLRGIGGEVLTEWRSRCTWRRRCPVCKAVRILWHERAQGVTIEPELGGSELVICSEVRSRSECCPAWRSKVGSDGRAMPDHVSLCLYPTYKLDSTRPCTSRCTSCLPRLPWRSDLQQSATNRLVSRTYHIVSSRRAELPCAVVFRAVLPLPANEGQESTHDCELYPISLLLLPDRDVEL